ncbi:MAG: polyprenol monophosphomannose synthase [Candidatus Yanofskybacteria bacterium]|nr:polyprenol monophosphomannose synthase [Candidatus Yanofskybacteria bacterium]
MTDNFVKTIVLIPTFNEKENIGLLVREIFGLYPDISILVIDDSSLDGTVEEALSMQSSFQNLFLIRRSGRRGLGRSYLDGFRTVASDQRYENIVTMDADFSHNPKEISPMLEKLSKEAPWIVGSRYVDGGGVENWSLRRKLLSRFANLYVGLILGAGVADMTAGFNCFKKNVLRDIDLESISSDGYAFLVELKYKAVKTGLRLSEHPITFSERREGQSKMSSGVIWESIWLPWRLRFRYKNSPLGS